MILKTVLFSSTVVQQSTDNVKLGGYNPAVIVIGRETSKKD